LVLLVFRTEMILLQLGIIVRSVSCGFIDSPCRQMTPTSPSVPAVGTNILAVLNQPQRDRRVRNEVLR
jgi:hypothetical protein